MKFFILSDRLGSQRDGVFIANVVKTFLTDLRNHLNSSNSEKNAISLFFDVARVPNY